MFTYDRLPLGVVDCVSLLIFFSATSPSFELGKKASKGFIMCLMHASWALTRSPRYSVQGVFFYFVFTYYRLPLGITSTMWKRDDAIDRNITLLQ